MFYFPYSVVQAGKRLRCYISIKGSDIQMCSNCNNCGGQGYGYYYSGGCLGQSCGNNCAGNVSRSGNCGCNCGCGQSAGAYSSYSSQNGCGCSNSRCGCSGNFSCNSCCWPGLLNLYRYCCASAFGRGTSQSNCCMFCLCNGTGSSGFSGRGYSGGCC